MSFFFFDRSDCGTSPPIRTRCPTHPINYAKYPNDPINANFWNTHPDHFHTTTAAQKFDFNHSGTLPITWHSSHLEDLGNFPQNFFHNTSTQNSEVNTPGTLQITWNSSEVEDLYRVRSNSFFTAAEQGSDLNTSGTLSSTQNSLQGDGQQYARDNISNTPAFTLGLANTISTYVPVYGVDLSPQAPSDNPIQGVTGSGTFICTVCATDNIHKSYKTKGDLSRHMKEHTVPGRFLCPEPDCPRGVEDNGFTRKDKLQAHLQTKHDLSKAQAALKVAQVAVQVRRCATQAQAQGE